MIVRKLVFSIFIAAVASAVWALDEIPEDVSKWTERGTVLSASTGIKWENKGKAMVTGIAKVDGTYFLYYKAGFDGCWNTDGDVNHQSVGLATSNDGEKFTKYSGNPVLKPHDFLPVGSEEEGIRTAYVRYIAEKKKFYAYCGVESPGGSDNCPFGGGSNCGCNVSVDAAVFLATSSDGKNWNVEGQVSGTYASGGDEVYASGWVYANSTFHLYITVAQGGYNKLFSRGTNPLKLTAVGDVSKLNFGWSGVDAFLHDDERTVTLIYNPKGGKHPGSSNDNLYFATVDLNDPRNLKDERIVQKSGTKFNQILKDGNEWKWYYGSSSVKLRTHPVDNAPVSVSLPNAYRNQNADIGARATSGHLHITALNAQIRSIRVVDACGKTVAFQHVFAGKQASISNLSNGTYTVIFSGKNVSGSHRIAVVK